MNSRWLKLGLVAAALGVLALLLTPHGSGGPGRLAAAGSDVPIWGFVVVGLALLLGLLFIVLGGRRRRDDADDAAGAAAGAPAAPRGNDPDVDAGETRGTDAATTPVEDAPRAGSPDADAAPESPDAGRPDPA